MFHKNMYPKKNTQYMTTNHLYHQHRHYIHRHTFEYNQNMNKYRCLYYMIYCKIACWLCC